MQNTEPIIGGLVKINSRDPRDNAYGQIGCLVVQRPNAGEPDGPHFLVDFGVRGSLVVNGRKAVCFEWKRREGITFPPELVGREFAA